VYVSEEGIAKAMSNKAAPGRRTPNGLSLRDAQKRKSTAKAVSNKAELKRAKRRTPKKEFFALLFI
jgi:hypothetical protein